MDLSIEGTLDFQSLTLPQKIAFKGVEKGGCALILGGGGVGKSHLIKIMKKHIPGLVATGTSGIASVNIDGITLDSYLGLRPNEDPASSIDMSEEKKQAIRRIKALLIDEGSFLRIDKFEHVDRILRTITSIDRPFGGIQIILVADFCQLPPVLTQYEKMEFQNKYKNALYCFESPLYEAADFTPYVLNSYVRQDDPEEQEILKHLRLNKSVPTCIKKILPRLRNKPFETGVSLYPTNKMVEHENNNRCLSVRGKNTSYIAEYDGEVPREEKTFPHELQLKPGFRVMTTVNKPESNFTNGDIGTILRCLSDSVIVELDRGMQITVPRVTREITQQVWSGNKVENEVIASISQLPLKMAYALTIHKSQGLTLDSVNLVLDKNGYFPFLGYVGVSRTRRLSDIHVRHALAPRCFSVNQKAIDFTITMSKIAMERRAKDIEAFGIKEK